MATPLARGELIRCRMVGLDREDDGRVAQWLPALITRLGLLFGVLQQDSLANPSRPAK